MNRFAAGLLLLAASAAHAAITGVLVDESGKPVAGATVRAYAGEDARAWQARVMAGKFDVPAIASAQSAENGAFKVDAKAPVVQIVVEAAGQQTHVEEASDGEDLEVVVLHPKPGRSIRVTAGGKPVGNATLVTGPLAIHGGADGVFELPDSVVRAVIVHPDFAPAVPLSAVMANAQDVVLSRGVAVRGHVLAADGQPVANATVSVDGWPMARSASDGSFAIEHAPASWRTLTAADAARAVSVRNARGASYDVRLQPAATISGTTLPGSRVMVSPNESESFDTVIADAQGKFTATSLPAGRYLMRSFKSGYAVAATELVTREGARETRTFTPRALGIIRGRVVDEENHPVAGAFVWHGMSSFRRRLTMTGTNGEFAVRRIEAARIAAVFAVKSGYAIANSGALSEDKNNITLTLPHGFPLQVRVIDTQRKLVSNALVSVMTGTALDYDVARSDAACEKPLATNCRTTGDDGEVHFRAVEGPYTVRVTGDSIVMKTMPAQTITAKTSPLIVEVNRGVEVSGRVMYSDRTPIADAAVMVRPFSGGGIAHTDADGMFTLRNVLPGKVAIVATVAQSNLESVPLEVDAPVHGVTLTVPTPSRIEGRVTDKETGQPVTDFQIAVSYRDRRGAFTPPQSFHSDDGSYALDALRAGDIDLQFGAAGHARGTLGGLTVDEGKTLRRADIALDRGGSIRGRVTSNGAPVSGAGVRFNEGRGMVAVPGLRTLNSTVTDDNGDYLIDGIGEGDRTVEAAKEGFVTRRKTVSITRGKEERLDIELDRGSILQGRVADKNGQPVAGAHVTAMPMGGAGGMFRPETTDASGAFTLSGLADGHYSVTATKDGYVSAHAQDVTVPVTAPVTLTLDSGGTVTGRITGLSQAELASAEVAVGGSGSMARAAANADGSFVVHGVPDGQVNVFAMTRGGLHPRQSLSQHVEVVNGSAPAVTIDFQEGLTVTGHVTRNGQPVTTGSVTFNGKGVSRTAGIAADGTYEVDGLTSGDYMVNAFGPSGPMYRAKYSVAADSTYDIQVAGSALRGRVVDASTGAPLSEVAVTTTGTRENPMRQTVTDTEGSFLLDALNDGTYELRAMHDHYATAIQTVTVSGGSAPDVEIRLETVQPTVFRVTDAQTGIPLDATISVTDGKRQIAQSHGVRGDDGGIRVYVAPGQYRAVAFSRGYVAESVNFSAPGPEVRVALKQSGRLMLMASKMTRVVIRSTSIVAGSPPGGGGIVRGAMASPSGTAVDNLAPGTYSIDVLGATPQTVVKSIAAVVIPGQTVTVNVD